MKHAITAILFTGALAAIGGAPALAAGHGDAANPHQTLTRTADSVPAHDSYHDADTPISQGLGGTVDPGHIGEEIPSLTGGGTIDPSGSLTTSGGTVDPSGSSRAIPSLTGGGTIDPSGSLTTSGGTVDPSGKATPILEGGVRPTDQFSLNTK